MTLDWSTVNNLAEPIETTENDVILSGHGEYTWDGETKVLDGVEFWLLAPPGASIADSTGQALENKVKIVQLGIKMPGNNVLSDNPPYKYSAGQQVPNYVLQPPRGIVIKPGGPHIIGVEVDTKLSDLWERVKPFIKRDHVIRCFWAACTAIESAKNPVVLYK